MKKYPDKLLFSHCYEKVISNRLNFQYQGQVEIVIYDNPFQILSFWCKKSKYIMDTFLFQCINKVWACRCYMSRCDSNTYFIRSIVTKLVFDCRAWYKRSNIFRLQYEYSASAQSCIKSFACWKNQRHETLRGISNIHLFYTFLRFFFQTLTRLLNCWLHKKNHDLKDFENKWIFFYQPSSSYKRFYSKKKGSKNIFGD